MLYRFQQVLSLSIFQTGNMDVSGHSSALLWKVGKKLYPMLSGVEIYEGAQDLEGYFPEPEWNHPVRAGEVVVVVGTVQKVSFNT